MNKSEKKFKNKYLLFACLTSLISIPVIFVFTALIPTPDYSFSDALFIVYGTIAALILASIIAFSYKKNNPSIAILATLAYIVFDVINIIHSEDEYGVVLLTFHIMLLALILILGILAIVLEVKLEETKEDKK
ncbi:MAG: hypothetical protein IKE63_03715 [Bacilli bacterium]|nr:hypothetical protein [Bacilli bacterium]